MTSMIISARNLCEPARVRSLGLEYFGMGRRRFAVRSEE